MVSWITLLHHPVPRRDRPLDAVIYTTDDWWRSCTGNYTGVRQRTNPLWVARYGSAVGSLPGGWPYHTFWQYSEAGGLDRDRFNGSYSNLTRLLADDGSGLHRRHARGAAQSGGLGRSLAVITGVEVGADAGGGPPPRQRSFGEEVHQAGRQRPDLEVAVLGVPPEQEASNAASASSRRPR